MIVYELTHIFFRNGDELICSPKCLGIYSSPNAINLAVQYFCMQPGFCDNQDAFSIRERTVTGNIADDTVFEALIYLHSEDYEFEVSIDLGLHGNEAVAQSKLSRYIEDNTLLVQAQAIICERIINKCIINRKEWTEGFSIR